MKGCHVVPIFFLLACSLLSGCGRDGATADKPNPQAEDPQAGNPHADNSHADNPHADNLDYASFKALAEQTAPVRSENRISVERFTELAAQPDTVILDTRSKRDYDDRHIKGAIHLNYADINEDSLRKLIPDPDTRVLIYCVNNFIPVQDELAMLAEHASAEAETAEAVRPYESVEGKVLVKEAGSRIEVKPGRYDWVEEQVLVGEGEELVLTPARYDPPPLSPGDPIPRTHEKVTEKVMVRQAGARTEMKGYEWVEGKVLVADEGEELVVTPAKYESRESRVMVTPPAKRVEVPVAEGPAASVTNGSRVMVSPPSTPIYEGMPGKYETITERVIVTSSGRPEVVVPAKYEWRVSRVLVKAATATSPAEYKTVRQNVLVEPPVFAPKKPAEYKTITRQRLVSPARTPVVDVPEEHKTVSQRVMVAPSVAGSKYKTITKRVMVTPPSNTSKKVPAKYDTVRVRRLVEPPNERNVAPARQRLVTPASTRIIEVPEEYKTESKRVMVAPPSVGVRRTGSTSTVSVRKMVEAPDESKTETSRVVRPTPDEPPKQDANEVQYDTSVALNVPTYMALAKHGYKHVFELGPALSWHTPRLQFGGTSVTRSPTLSADKDLAVEKAAAKKEHVDFETFVRATKNNEALWRQRLVSAEQFEKMAAEPGTIILDVRSKESYDRKRLRNARHLNFSEFSEKKLDAFIPDSETRILIYGDSNLEADASSARMAKTALTLPTFVHLLTYGYPNVYVLGESVAGSDLVIGNP